MRCSMVSARMASPRYSKTWPVPPPTPIRAISARMMSLAADARSEPRRRRGPRRSSGRAGAGDWVARTISTSLVPIPKASAPNAPCVEVCESPHTIVMPGWVSPSCGPMTWTMPWRRRRRCRGAGCRTRRSSLELAIWAAAIASSIGRLRGVVGIEWSAVATVWSGSADREPPLAQAGERLGQVTSWTRWRSIARTAGAPGSCDDDVVVPDLVDERARFGHGWRDLRDVGWRRRPCGHRRRPCGRKGYQRVPEVLSGTVRRCV